MTDARLNSNRPVHPPVNVTVRPREEWPPLPSAQAAPVLTQEQCANLRASARQALVLRNAARCTQQVKTQAGMAQLADNEILCLEIQDPEIRDATLCSLIQEYTQSGDEELQFKASRLYAYIHFTSSKE